MTRIINLSDMGGSGFVGGGGGGGGKDNKLEEMLEALRNRLPGGLPGGIGGTGSGRYVSEATRQRSGFYRVMHACLARRLEQLEEVAGGEAE